MLKLVSICLLAAWVTVAGTSSAADIDVVIYADDRYPPYSYVESGKPRGIYVDILNAAFSRMKGYNVRIKPVPWKRGLRLLEQGKGFALFPPYLHVEDRPFIWPYSVPILDEHTVVFCREDVMGQPRPNWPEDYFGLTIGMSAGYRIGGDRFRKAAREGKIRIDESEGTTENLIKLVKGRLDGYVNDRLSIIWELDRLRRSGAYRVKDGHAKCVEAVTVSSQQGYLGYTNRDEGRFPFKADFVMKFDAIIQAMKVDGEIQSVIDGFFDRVRTRGAK
jgi:polar amino acid transport system substrate-binding protein